MLPHSLNLYLRKNTVKKSLKTEYVLCKEKKNRNSAWYFYEMHTKIFLIKNVSSIIMKNYYGKVMNHKKFKKLWKNIQISEY